MKRAINLLFIGMLFLVGCSDPEVWDDHYKTSTKSSELIGTTVIDKIETLDQCSNFYNALLDYKLDTLLDNSFLFTILAPTNEYFDINKYPEDEKLRNIQMYILFGEYFTNDISGRRKMMSGKFLNFTKNEGSGLVSIDNRVDIILDQDNVSSNNGVVHVVDSIIEYRQSTYEYLNENFESIAQYFEGLIVKEVDYKKSQWTGQFNKDGLRILDTVWVETNTFLRDVVDLTNDELEYTVIIPSGDVVDNAIEQNVVQYFGSVEAIPSYIYTSIFDDILGASVFPGAYLKEDLPEILTSVLFRETPIDKDALLTWDAELSNGVVHTTSEIEIDNSSFLQIKDIQILRDVYDQATAYVPWRQSTDDIAFKATSYLIWQTRLPDHEGVFMEFDFKDFLATDYQVSFNPGSNWGSAKFKFEIISEHLDEYDSHDPETNLYTKEINTIDYGLFNGGDVLGTISFGSFGDATLKVTMVGQADPGPTDRDDKFRLRSFTFTPVDLIQ